MTCHECGKRPATLHFTKIISGKKTEFHLCDVCAKEKGEFIPGTDSVFSIHNLLSGLLSYNPLDTSGTTVTKPLTCDFCGLSYTQFSQSGRFGCSKCYTAFAKQLDPLFKRVHGNTTHGGKIPSRAGSEINERRLLRELKSDLSHRIEQEEFEVAAKLRDQIRELEQKLNGS